MRPEDYKIATTLRRIESGQDIKLWELERLERVLYRLRCIEEDHPELRDRIAKAIDAVMVPCNGEAHSNPWIDNCMVCAPRWGAISWRKGLDTYSQER